MLPASVLPGRPGWCSRRRCWPRTARRCRSGAHGRSAARAGSGPLAAFVADDGRQASSHSRVSWRRRRWRRHRGRIRVTADMFVSWDGFGNRARVSHKAPHFPNSKCIFNVKYQRSDPPPRALGVARESRPPIIRRCIAPNWRCPRALRLAWRRLFGRWWRRQSPARQGTASPRWTAAVGVALPGGDHFGLLVPAQRGDWSASRPRSSATPRSPSSRSACA